MASWKRLKSRGNSAFSAYQSTGDPKELEVAVAALQEGLAVGPQHGADHAMMLADIGTVLLARYKQDGDPEDLDAAIDTGRRAVAESASVDDPMLAMHLAKLADALVNRSRQGGDGADAEEAVETVERAVSISPNGSPLHSAMLAALGSALLAKYERNDNDADLDAAVATIGQAAQNAQLLGAFQTTVLSNLGYALRARYERFGRGPDLDAAIEASSRAAQSAQSARPDQDDGALLTTLAAALALRFRKNGDGQDLDQAVEASRRAALAVPPEHPNRPACLTTLAAVLQLRSAQNGSAEDLTAAIEAAQLAVDSSSSGHPELPTYLANLTSALMERFERSGDRRDLDAAIEASRRGASAAPSLSSRQAVFLSNLGMCLVRRFRQALEITDMEAAHDALQQAADMAKPGDPNRPIFLSNLSGALLIWSVWTLDRTHLGEAVDALREVVALMEPGDPNRPMHLANLGMALYTRFGMTGDHKDLDAAINYEGQALGSLPVSHPGWTAPLSVLAPMLRDRFVLTRNEDDLFMAIGAGRQAVEAVPDGHPSLAFYRFRLATCLRTRFGHTGDPADLDAAIDNWRQVVDQVNADTDTRVQAARRWGAAAAEAGRAREAAEGYTAAIDLMPAAAWHGLYRASREAELAELAGMATDGTACAIWNGDPGLALRLAEQGRSVLWNQALDLRGDLTRLAEEAPELSQRLDQIRTVIDAPEPGLTPGSPEAWFFESEASPASAFASGTRISASLLVDQRMALAKEWDELVGQVRQLRGFTDFLQMPSLDRLLGAAADGPVAVINISRWRCDALIVTPAGVRVQELPGVSANAVADQANEYLRVQRAVDRAAYELHEARRRFDRGDRAPEVFRIYTGAKQAVHDAERERDQALAAILAWLWDEIADPVLTACGFVTSPEPGAEPPHLWWCPTGPLTMLPLHAAGHYVDQSLPMRTVMNRVVSSYTPTLRALLEARRPLHPEPEAERALVVTVPEANGQVPLADVAREQQALASSFPGRHTVLDGSGATWEAVRRELPRHQWAHFSCHGGQDITDPSHGGLLLHDRLLSVVDISTEQYRGEFAFLSSCMTATGGAGLADEAITLAAALHYGGYRHVIGTLWSVYDDNAAALAEAIYRDLAQASPPSAARSAYALHHAILGLRNDQHLPPSGWAPFAHIGP